VKESAASQPADDNAPIVRSESVTRQAAFSIGDPYIAAIAEDILLRGGNAVDAAVATAFGLAVTYIDAGNIGGGGFMLAYMNGEASFLDYREKAALAAHRDMFLDDKGEFIPDSTLIGGQAAAVPGTVSTLIGGQAAAVPGTVAGMWIAHQRFGNLTWSEVVLPAAELAEKGFYPASYQLQ
jgi:gamma-glutamyltranspeptidase/glutathione hydrolase